MEKSEHVCPHPRIVQLVSHGNDLFALDDHGEMFVRSRDPFINQGPHSAPSHSWAKVAGPDGV